jgi:hypothetical protein
VSRKINTDVRKKRTCPGCPRVFLQVYIQICT